VRLKPIVSKKIRACESRGKKIGGAVYNPKHPRGLRKKCVQITWLEKLAKERGGWKKKLLTKGKCANRMTRESGGEDRSREAASSPDGES